MRHIGDLQPLERPDFGGGRPMVGRYSAQRSRWRFALGSWEVGFDRASERIHAETAPTKQAESTGGLGDRLMIRLGMLCVALLMVAVTGWLWSLRDAGLGGSSVSASIIDHSAVADDGAREATGLTGPRLATSGVPGAPAERPSAFLSVVIEERAPAPVSEPAPRAAVQIAQGEAIKPRAAQEAAVHGGAPDEAIVRSGNFMLIPNVERAVGLAMRNGDAQNWTAGAYHGVVVVGDAAPKAGKSCREGTVLLRDDSDEGRTQRFERCV